MTKDDWLCSHLPVAGWVLLLAFIVASLVASE